MENEILKCSKCDSAFYIGFRSLNDRPSIFDLGARKSRLKKKLESYKISQELFDFAMTFIETGQVFDILECINCGEVIAIIEDNEYTKTVKKLLETFKISDPLKEKPRKKKKDIEKELFYAGKLTVGRKRNGKRLIEQVEETEDDFIREEVEHEVIVED
jgi:hypothetical protein